MRVAQEAEQPSAPNGALECAPGLSLRGAALVAICALAAAVPTDQLVAYALQADQTFRTPSVYLSIVALLLALPFLPGAGLGRRIAPILLIAGSMVLGMLSLATLRWSGFAGGP